MPRHPHHEKGKHRRPVEGADRGNVEVLIAHDPMLQGLDSDDEVDYSGGVSGGGLLGSISGLGSTNHVRRDSSHSSTSSGQSKTKKKKEKAEKKKETKQPANANEDGVDNEEVFYVEKIKDKRFTNGRWEYLLQWQGYGPEHDTWEPTTNMDCDDLLVEFEAEWSNKPKFGFDRGEVAREIIGLCIMEGKPRFLVLYKNSDDVELVPREECAKYCPHLVIEFYENRQLALGHHEQDKEADTEDPEVTPEVAAPTTSSSTTVPSPVST